MSAADPAEVAARRAAGVVDGISSAVGLLVGAGANEAADGQHRQSPVRTGGGRLPHGCAFSVADQAIRSGGEAGGGSVPSVDRDVIEEHEECLRGVCGLHWFCFRLGVASRHVHVPGQLVLKAPGCGYFAWFTRSR